MVFKICDHVEAQNFRYSLLAGTFGALGEIPPQRISMGLGRLSEKSVAAGSPEVFLN